MVNFQNLKGSKLSAVHWPKNGADLAQNGADSGSSGVPLEVHFATPTFAPPSALVGQASRGPFVSILEHGY